MTFCTDNKPARQGVFIVFEGIEGSGKSTQAKHLSHWLQNHLNKSVILTREPGGTPVAEKIRNLVLNHDDQTSGENICSETELLLMMAARLQHFRQVIQPALAAGQWVICDRFIASSLAYQGAGRGLELEMINDLHQRIAPEMKPDLTFVLDIDVPKSRSRLQARQQASDRMESNQDDFFQRARDIYVQLAEQASNAHVIPADQSVVAVEQAIQRLILNHTELAVCQ